MCVLNLTYPNRFHRQPASLNLKRILFNLQLASIQPINKSCQICLQNESLIFSSLDFLPSASHHDLFLDL